MRISPIITLGLTSLGIFSWFCYGTSVLNAAALEPSKEEPERGEEKEEDAVDAYNSGLKAQSVLSLEQDLYKREEIEIGGDASIAASLHPSFSGSDIALREASVSRQFKAEVASYGWPTSSQRQRQDNSFDRSLDTDQIKRVVSQASVSVFPEAANQEEVGAAQSSFGGAFSAATTRPTVSLPLSSVAGDASSRTSTRIKQLTELAPDVVDAPPANISGSGSSLSSFTAPSSTNHMGTPAFPPGSFAPPATSFPTSSSVLSTGVDENYILGPGDIIDVSFFNVPEYSGQHRVSTSGTIDLPLIGRASVNGLTLNQAGLAIAQRYESQLQSPVVSVNVVQQRPVQVAISGEITQPGLYTVVAQGSDYPRLFQALQQAGGLTQAADLNNVAVRRRDVNGQQVEIEVDLLALLQEGDISQNIFLQDGDSVLIPSSTELDRVALNQLAGSNLRANDDRPINVAIVGEVTQPGPYQLSSGIGQATVVQALQEAGGITPSANLREIQLRRRTRQGGQQTFNIDLWELLQNGDVSQDLTLQQGDTLTVPVALDLSIEEITSLSTSTLSPGTIDINIVGEVESPGRLAVDSSTSFNEALLASGGLNRRARQEATLIRFNSNGTVDRQFIDVNLSSDINSETNPLLRPNDVIVVGRSAKAAFDDSVQGLSNTLNLVLPFLFLL